MVGCQFALILKDQGLVREVPLFIISIIHSSTRVAGATSNGNVTQRFHKTEPLVNHRYMVRMEEAQNCQWVLEFLNGTEPLARLSEPQDRSRADLSDGRSGAPPLGIHSQKTILL